jgi:hypothetical protein
MTISCGGTLTNYDVSGSPDDFPEHAALHEQIRDLQRQVNAAKDLLERTGGWWLRFRLVRYLRSPSFSMRECRKAKP